MKTMSIALLCAVCALGCAAEVDPDDACGEDGCDQRVTVKLEPDLDCDANPRCVSGMTLVYLSELPDPIIVATTPAGQTAEVTAPEGSFLVVERGDQSCMVDVRFGEATCAAGGSIARLTVY